jgi:hypothetical protein
LNFYWRDVLLCDKVFRWSDSEFQELVDDVDHKMTLFKTAQDDLIMYDGLKFDRAYKKWTQENQDWIKQQELMEEHKQKHRTREQYEENVRTWISNGYNEEEYRQDCPFVDTSQICEYCIAEAMKRLQEEQVRKEREERRKQEDAEREEKQREEDAEREADEAADREWRRSQMTQFEPITCECCPDFTAQSQLEWNFHIKSREHKIREKHKSLYCSICDVQCKSDAEYHIHLNTNKHKKKCGDVPSVYRCECCNYETHIKGNYQLHLLSKKHLANKKV